MADPGSLVPDGLVAEVMAGHVVLDMADGTQVVITIPKARWELFTETRERRDLADRMDPDMWAIFAEQWYGLRFHALEMLPGPNRAAFRLTHFYQPGGPRARLDLPEEDT
jgi:hypothetical protein